VARAALRHLLGRELGIPAADLEFEYGPHGKPALCSRRHGEALRFNVSHSADLVLIGLVRGREIGVDLEFHRGMNDRDQVATRFFSANEVREYLQLADEERKQAFYDCWTRKEAVIKAIGRGLAFPLSGFDVSLSADVGQCSLRFANPGDGPWCLHAFHPRDDYSGAVVVQGAACHLDLQPRGNDK
jgi:4'-phosphopantetheinyl transferase